MKEEIRSIEGMLIDKDAEIYYNGQINAIKRVLAYLNI